MDNPLRQIIQSLSAVLFCLLIWGGPSAFAASMSVRVQAEMSKAGPGEKIPVIVRMTEPVSVQTLAVPPAATGAVRAQARANLVRTLRARAESSRQPLRDLLRSRGIERPKDLWLINGLAFRATPELIAELEALPGVASIVYDQVVHPPRVVTAADANGNAVEDNIDLVNAPALWDAGFTGQGVTVAIVDTGVDVEHADLSSRWRGGGNSWYNAVAAECTATDPQVVCATPCDLDTTMPCDYVDPDGIAHGTGVAGVAVGGSAGGTAIGIAPGAQWIAAKIFDSADNAPASVIIDALGWMLDPDGDPGTDDAPDIVNASWGLEGALGLCVQDFRAAVQNLKAAGIAVVFAAGNTGPVASSSISPGNYQESFAIGSVGTSQSPTTVSDFSARGPSACDGTVYPEITAPGFQVRTADITAGGVFPFSYTIESGTSFAAPHAAGVMALLLSAFPGTPAADLELALEQSAVDLGTAGPDNAYGYGLINAAAAFDFLAAEPNIGVTDSSDPQTDGILAFGHVPPGETAAGTIQVRNAGSADLVLGSIDATGVSDPFSLTGDGCSNARLIPGQSCTLSLRFAPTALGSFGGGLDIPSNDPDQPLIAVELTGIGNTPPVAPQPSSPADGAFTGSPVTFSWVPASDPDGDGVSQTLVVAPHPDFTAAETFPVDPVAPLAFGAGALLLAGLATNRRRRLVLLLLAGGLLAGMVACGGGGGGGAEPPPDTQSTTLTGFTSGVTYYWKMRAEDTRGAVTESAVRSFTVQ